MNIETLKFCLKRMEDEVNYQGKYKVTMSNNESFIINENDKTDNTIIFKEYINNGYFDVYKDNKNVYYGIDQIVKIELIK